VRMLASAVRSGSQGSGCLGSWDSLVSGWSCWARTLWAEMAEATGMSFYLRLLSRRRLLNFSFIVQIGS